MSSATKAQLHGRPLPPARRAPGRQGRPGPRAVRGHRKRRGPPQAFKTPYAPERVPDRALHARRYASRPSSRSSTSMIAAVDEGRREVAPDLRARPEQGGEADLVALPAAASPDGLPSCRRRRSQPKVVRRRSCHEETMRISVDPRRGVGALLSASIVGAAEQETYKVIVNAANPETTISTERLSALFLKTSGSGPAGSPFCPSISRSRLRPGSPSRRMSSTNRWWRSRTTGRYQMAPWSRRASPREKPRTGKYWRMSTPTPEPSGTFRPRHSSRPAPRC